MILYVEALFAGREKKKEASALTPIAKQLKNYLQENGADMMLGGLLVAAAALLAGGVDDAVVTGGIRPYAPRHARHTWAKCSGILGY